MCYCGINIIIASGWNPLFMIIFMVRHEENEQNRHVITKITQNFWLFHCVYSIPSHNRHSETTRWVEMSKNTRYQTESLSLAHFPFLYCIKEWPTQWGKKKTVDEEWDAWNRAQMKKTQSDHQVLYLATLHVKINGLEHRWINPKWS